MTPAMQSTSLSDIMHMPTGPTIKQSSIVYKAGHLLGLPQEIRCRIYEAARDNINSQIEVEIVASKLSQYPSTGFEGLRLVNRQLYHEVPRILGTSVVLQRSINIFLNTPIESHSTWDNFRSIYVEVPHRGEHRRDVEIFGRLAHALKQVAYQLQDLRLYGVGLDAHDTPTSSQTKACGKFDNSMSTYQKALPTSGQNWMLRLPLINAIQLLVNLRTLVLDNLNMPLLQAHVLKNKPDLESLYMCMDHRTTLHSEYLMDRRTKLMVGNLMWGVTQPCQLKQLEISMNSTMHVGHTIGLSLESLERLTIIVPDQSKQSATQKQSNWIGDLARIFQSVLRYAKKLRTLKICIHAALYENDTWSGEFIGAFKMYMPEIMLLQVVELHLQPRSCWVAQEFMEALPTSVERFYAPEIFFNCDFKAMLTMLASKTGLDPDGYDHTKSRIIGEDLMRRDSTIFPISKLRFMGYEYAVERAPIPHQRQKDHAIELLKLNAKLLDRHRNRHLAICGGCHIPLDSKEPASADEYNAAVMAARMIQLDRHMFDDIPELHVFATEHQYFGKEHEAEEIFYKEAVARAEDLQPLTYPAFEDVSNDFKHSNHWISE